ncbi:MAG TPA: lytic murein transglycosylase [Xanthobacteraceae bacterium]|jgi:lytic murein transglycosylase|nr:lytic murein transglycosylase [Xanthobacteraceae bacterium]
MDSDRTHRFGFIAAALGLSLAIAWVAPARADEAFQQFLQSLWPEVQKIGIARATFDAATRGLEPDLTLPDLDVPGRPERPPPGQPEFVQTPAGYLRESSFERLAARGRKLYAEYRETLTRIEQEFGVPGNIVLAIWGRESDYSTHYGGRDAIQVLATQAYVGRRKQFFRNEFVYALKMLQDGVPRSQLRSSWGGAMGLTQFLPSEYYKYGVDLERKGRVDIWTSVPDALASAAKQLVGEGWQREKPWAYEVRVPSNVDCTLANPDHKRPLAEWLKRGFVLANGKPRSGDLTEPASLLQPAGIYGPGFLIFHNYFALKEYNFSDLYVLFVGHLADRIAGERPFATPWEKVVQLKTADLERMQRLLTARGFYQDKIDGKAGMKTRLALGAFQKANGLKLDCWPSADVLGKMGD